MIGIQGRVLGIKVLKFSYSGPEHGQKRGQIGDKLGYAAYNVNCHGRFFCFSSGFDALGMCIRQTWWNIWFKLLYCENDARIGSFSDFSEKVTYFFQRKCANRFGMVSKSWKASLTQFLTKSVPEWSNRMVYSHLNSIYHI